MATGNAPDAVVDRDGITHLVWNETRTGGQADVLHYCQLPRGGDGVHKRASFVPPSDQPSINGDLYGPKVMVTPFGEVIVLTHRCVNQVVGRYAPNVLYVSEDGGHTFGAPAAVSNVPPGGASRGGSAVYDGADRRIRTAAPRSDGVAFQAAPVGQWTTAAADPHARARPRASCRSCSARATRSWSRGWTATGCRPGCAPTPARWTGAR